VISILTLFIVIAASRPVNTHVNTGWNGRIGSQPFVYEHTH